MMNERSTTDAFNRWVGQLTGAEQCYAGACLAEYQIAAAEGRLLVVFLRAEVPHVPVGLSRASAARIRQTACDLVAEMYLRELADEFSEGGEFATGGG